jgi:hypothetical protein
MLTIEEGAALADILKRHSTDAKLSAGPAEIAAGLLGVVLSFKGMECRGPSPNWSPNGHQAMREAMRNADRMAERRVTASI